jgi:hypothetical protein
MERRALQDVVEPGGGLVVTRVVWMQLLDPSPRGAVARSLPLGRRGRRGAVDTHDLIVVGVRGFHGIPQDPR